MTDKDIIKALELCFAEKGTKQTCGECPYHQFGELCKVNRDRDALDLINRLQAEIERLKYQVNRLKNYDERRDIALHSRLIANARAEAIKEFAERLKGKICDSFGFVRHGKGDIDIDNLVKEMVGESYG